MNAWQQELGERMSLVEMTCPTCGCDGCCIVNDVLNVWYCWRCWEIVVNVYRGDPELPIRSVGGLWWPIDPGPATDR